jgi:GAF domain-containing protein
MDEHAGGFSTWPEDGDKAALHSGLASQIDGLLSGDSDPVANLTNAAAAIYHSLPNLNWAGFYLLRDGELVPGPFQGKPARVRIPLGKGVCGTAAASRRSVLVRDVHAFPGHIACDSASASELVVPLLRDEAVLAYWTWTVRLRRASMPRIRQAARHWRRPSFATRAPLRLSDRTARCKETDPCSSTTAPIP